MDKKTVIFTNIFIVILVVSISSYLLFYNSFIYGLSDAYYYSSIAEGYFKYGVFFDNTGMQRGIVSIQNGIVFIHIIMIKLGLDNVIDRLNILSLFNILITIVTVFFIKNILHNIFELSKKYSFYVVLILCLTPEFYTTMLQPINDVYFIFLSILFIYVVFDIEIDYKYRIFLLVLISLVINHFRIQGIFLFLSIIISNIYLKNYNKSIFQFFLILLSLLSVKIVNYLYINDFSQIEKLNNMVFESFNLYEMWSNFLNIINYTLPLLVFSTSKFSEYYSFIFYIVVLFVLYFGVLSFKNKDEKRIFLFLLVSMNVALLTIFLVQEPRYLIAVYPFIIYVLFLHMNKEILGRSFVTILICILVMRFYFAETENTLDRNLNINFNVDYSINKENRIKLLNQIEENDFDIVSENNRVTYFLFKQNVRYDFIQKDEFLYIGEENQLNILLGYLKNQKGYKIKNIVKTQLKFLIKNGLKPDSEGFIIRLEKEGKR